MRSLTLPCLLVALILVLPVGARCCSYSEIGQLPAPACRSTCDVSLFLRRLQVSRIRVAELRGGQEVSGEKRRQVESRPVKDRKSHASVKKPLKNLRLQALFHAARNGNATAQYELGMLQIQWLERTRPESRSIVCARAVKWVQRAAEGGCMAAEETLALWTLEGSHGVPKNQRKGFEHMLALAHRGSFLCMRRAGYCLDEGVGVDRNRTEGIRWYRRSAEEGDDPAAMYNLGVCYYYGHGVPKNVSQACEWLRKAALWGRDEWVQVNEYASQLKSLGYAKAQFMLGICYLNGEGVEVDHETGIELLSYAGEQNHTDSLHLLGTCFYEGLALDEPDYLQAFTCWSKAASLGCLKSKHRIAMCYSEGKGVKQNERKCAALLLENAGCGWNESLKLAGLCYIEAKGVKRDEEKGLDLYMQATGVSMAQAQYEIGRRFLKAEGWLKTPNEERAVSWLARAADEQHLEAMVLLAPLLMDGSKGGAALGLRNVSRGVSLIAHAAESGHAGAQLALGDYYHKGFHRFHKDLNLATTWWSRAASQGNEEAKTRLGKLYARKGNVSGVDQTIRLEEEEEDEYVKLAAENGDPKAQVVFARRLLGSQDMREKGEAVLLLQRAALTGEAEAMYEYGRLHLDGNLMHRSAETAYRWLRGAAKKGNTDAMFAVSRMLMEGEGVEKRERRGRQWLTMAAKRGHARAMFNLHLLLRGDGRGDPQELREANVWLERAASAGHPKAQLSLAVNWMQQENNSTGGTQSERMQDAIKLLQSAAASGYQPARALLMRARH